MEPGEIAGEVIVFVRFFALLAAVLGLGLLVLAFCWRLAFGPRRASLPHAPSPPDDWDDEEYIARHHH